MFREGGHSDDAQVLGSPSTELSCPKCQQRPAWENCTRNTEASQRSTHGDLPSLVREVTSANGNLSGQPSIFSLSAELNLPGSLPHPPSYPYPRGQKGKVGLHRSLGPLCPPRSVTGSFLVGGWCFSRK